jgi:hypothetical protein
MVFIWVVLFLVGCESTILPAPERPLSNGSKEVRSTIVINKAGSYDFENVLHIWKGQKWDCNAGKENGPQILRIEADNVQVRNFHFLGDGSTLGSHGLGDPIHIATCGKGQGNECPKAGPNNVVLRGIVGHACEDLITTGRGARNITIEDSWLSATPRAASRDKTIQINFGHDIKIMRNVFFGGTRCVRFKPSTSGEVVGNWFLGCETALQASSNDADISPMKNGPVIIKFSGNNFENVKNKVKALGSQVSIKE